MGLMPMFLPFLIPVVVLVGVFATVIVAMIFKSKANERDHRERMVMIEKGMEIPEHLYAPPKKEKGIFELSAARGEVECLQVGIRTDGLDPNYMRAEVSDLAGSRRGGISAENVDIFYPEYVPVKWGAADQIPGDFPHSARCTQKIRFVRVADINSQSPAIPEVFLDDLRHVVEIDVNVLDS